MKKLAINILLILICLNNKVDSSTIFLSERLTLEVGFKETNGNREKMEDSCEIKSLKYSPHFTMFGIYDGHGGNSCAKYLERNLITNIYKKIKKIENKTPSTISSAIENSFLKTNRKYLSTNKQPGSAAIVALLKGKKLFTANVGDSRAILYRKGKIIPLSTDQKPGREDERIRIEKLGGKITGLNPMNWNSIPRVQGALAISRAFGNPQLNTDLIKPKPEITYLQVGSNDEFIIMASDGLWDVIENQEAIEIVKACESAEKASALLIKNALYKGSTDNISVIVIKNIAEYVSNLTLHKILFGKINLENLTTLNACIANSLNNKNSLLFFHALDSIFINLHKIIRYQKLKMSLKKTFKLAYDKRTIFGEKKENIRRMYKKVKNLL